LGWKENNRSRNSPAIAPGISTDDLKRKNEGFGYVLAVEREFGFEGVGVSFVP
jgi:hypothetical protein